MNEKTPFVMGTRYGPGGGVDKDWPLFRRLMSAVARSLARPLTSTSDPMSGFFGLSSDLVSCLLEFIAIIVARRLTLVAILQYRQSSRVNPVGFKIALELLLKTGVSRNSVAEVAYSFSKRTVGESKLSSKTIFRYVFHLAALYRWWIGFFGLILLELVLVAACWVGLFAVEFAARLWRQRRRQDFRKRQKYRLDV